MMAGAEALGVYTLEHPSGIRARILALGGVVQSLEVPDRGGRLGDVVLGFEDPASYRQNGVFFGALVGRYANRIARGSLSIDGTTYRLPKNDGEHHLHGGPRGFYAVVWQVVEVRGGDAPAIQLRHVSPDGEEGYPGRLIVDVVYSLTATRALRIEYTARSDRPTAVNLTHHSYFNLHGAGAETIADHVLSLAASHFLPVDDGLIPTGEIRSVQGTPFDFRAPTRLGARIDTDDPQLRLASGYDHCYVSAHRTGALATVAQVVEPRSGRRMVMNTTEPGVQLYTGNRLGGVAGKDGVRYPPRSGFCLEAQHFPDSPNRPEFPPTVLRPGEVYRQTTEYVFSAF